MPQSNPFGTGNYGFSAPQNFGQGFTGGGIDLSFLRMQPSRNPTFASRGGSGMSSPWAGQPGRMSSGEPSWTGPTNHPGGGVNKFNELYREWATGPGGIRTQRSGGGQQQGPAIGGAVNQFMDASWGDAARMQGAADRQFGRNQAEIDGLRSFISGAAPGFMTHATEQADELRRIAGGLTTDLGKDMKAFDKFRDSSLNEQRRGNQAAVTAAREATTGFGNSIREYRDTSFHDASIAAAGIRESFDQGLRMSGAGLGPDGRRLSAAEQFATRGQAMESMNRSVAQSVMPHLSRVAENTLQANNALAQMKQYESQTLQHGADALAQSQLGYSGQRTQLQAMANQMRELSASLNAQAAGLRAGAHLKATQFELQGRLELARLTHENPESVVSLAPILAQGMALATSPGANQLPGFSMPQSIPGQGGGQPFQSPGGLGGMLPGQGGGGWTV